MTTFGLLDRLRSTSQRRKVGSIRLRRAASMASLLASSTLLAACVEGTNVESTESDQQAHKAEISHVGEHVLSVLSRSPNMRGRTWDVSFDNRFDADFIVQTPTHVPWGRSLRELDIAPTCNPKRDANCDPDFLRFRCVTQDDCIGGGACAPLRATVSRPGEEPRSMCLGHSDSFVDDIYDVIVGAKRFVDITSLQPADDLFESGIRNAVTFLGAGARDRLTIRYLVGAIPVQGRVDTKKVAKRITRDLRHDSPVEVAVSAFRSKNVPPSWNHSKIIAADGEVALVGGHNMWSQHYLSMNPVHDLSMRVHGTAARDAHRFANELWGYACADHSWSRELRRSIHISRVLYGRDDDDCPRPYSFNLPEGESSGTVISVGRLGEGIVKKGNQADDALLAMIDAAQSSVRMSLQDIGPIKVPLVGIPLSEWPEDVLDAIGRALARGVDVYIVISSRDAVAGGLNAFEAPYTNGWSPIDIARKLRKEMSGERYAPRGRALDELLCKRLHVAPFRYSDDATWPDGVPVGNHAKTLIVDDQAFYIGSHNLYSAPASLQEFGYIVDDSVAARSYLDNYWNRIWEFSRRAAVSGSESPRCEL